MQELICCGSELARDCRQQAASYSKSRQQAASHRVRDSCPQKTMAPYGAIVRRRSGRPWGRRAYSALRTPALASRPVQDLPASRHHFTGPATGRASLPPLPFLCRHPCWALQMNSRTVITRSSVSPAGRGAPVVPNCASRRTRSGRGRRRRPYRRTEGWGFHGSRETPFAAKWELRS